ncbi:hypothetical protein J2S74_002948 [Evansella vedderi]|uniref:Uncharacterized protein n=1 Tax=Evansella vedderi TaxID=38282 RepID=A0ABT9ZY00_9BACI|nr:DNA methylase N-4/N-6 [Evansella vedderi]MDQ0255566.1 hypothetical protein [Evansella vedderi]
MLSSIMSFEDRGKWGKSNYRGNCSGYIIKGLLDHYQPKHFLEVFAGGGTGFDVAKELGYKNSTHLDLNPKYGGWNALTDEVPEGSDFVFLHPPYHNIIQYSGKMWGQPHPDDLSRCKTYDEFIKKLDLIHSKVYSSLRNGGRMAILIGDVRKKGEYFSIQRDMAWIGQLDAHIIKAQHNCVSDNRRYAGKFIPIQHEHLLVFKKGNLWIVPVAVTKKASQDLRHSLKVTWRDLVQASLEELGGSATLENLYAVIDGTAKAKKNNFWREKVRQTLQIGKEFKPVSRGHWTLSNGAQMVA